MDNSREHLYLAALLHDIGKFYQRADTGSVATSKRLSEINKVEGVFLPSRQGYYSHKHCLWTAQFIDDHKTVFKNLIGEDFSDMADRNNLFSLAACHHLKKEQLSDLGKIIKEADCLSSGMDRDTDKALLDEQDENNWDSFKTKRMTSLLETVHAGQGKLRNRLPVTKISLTKDYFPKEIFENKPDYETLWHDFVNDFQLINADDYKAFCDTLLNLLYKYTSCIPASTINFPDVSLYDHLKTTAAIALCLYDFQHSNIERTSKKDRKIPKAEKKEAAFLLIGANFSGIQSYLYQTVSKYAGKNLKGRSFFLRILSDAVVRYVVDKLHLFQANVIYNSGGGFYLIAPNTKFVKDNLQEAIQTIEQHFFDSFGTALYVAIESVPVSIDGLMHKEKAQSLGEIWHALFKKLDKKKTCKWADLMTKGYPDFFEPLMQGADALRDVITGEEFSITELSDNKALTIKKDTNRQIVLGEKLRDTDTMIISTDELPYLRHIFSIQPANLGYHYYFLNETKDASLLKSVDNCTVVRFNSEKFNLPVKGNNNAYELQFYGGNEWKGHSFEDMVKAEGEERSIKRLGVLRMDVDNLGYIFQTGIANDRATLSRFAALSRSFDYFFSGYLNTIWKDVDPDLDNSFIIYSGGDDVFIVGRWDVIIRIAKRIRDDFREFTCYNPAFSISGGIAIVPEKFPIMKGADESANEEKAAKNHTIKGASKNALSFMDFPMNWDTEFPVIEQLKDELVRLIETENAPKSLLSKIMVHATNAGIKAHRITNLKTFWMLTYDLSRMKERAKPGLKQLINNCITEVCGNKPQLNGLPIETQYHALELWSFASRWAEIEYRIPKG